MRARLRTTKGSKRRVPGHFLGGPIIFWYKTVYPYKLRGTKKTPHRRRDRGRVRRARRLRHGVALDFPGNRDHGDRETLKSQPVERARRDARARERDGSGRDVAGQCLHRLGVDERSRHRRYSGDAERRRRGDIVAIHRTRMSTTEGRRSASDRSSEEARARSHRCASRPLTLVETIQKIKREKVVPVLERIRQHEAMLAEYKRRAESVV